MPWTERTITYLTQDELERFFGVIKDKRDRVIFALIYLLPPDCQIRRVGPGFGNPGRAK